MSNAGRSLELFFIDGRPDGMLTAEVFNWTGHVLRAPRTQVKQALDRPESGNTGVYLLLGEVDGRPRLYVGESEDMGDRLRSHVQNKEWWDSLVLISTAHDALHKALVKYLESRLVEIARDVGAIDLENGNTPPRSSLSEAATASMESFLDTLMMVLPAIGITAFDKKERISVVLNPSEASSGPLFVFRSDKKGLFAEAVLVGGELIVKAGSKVSPIWSGNRTAHAGYAELHDRLVKNGTIAVSATAAHLTTDFAFGSPSQAAAIVAGVVSAGRHNWKNLTTGQTYAEWEAAQLTQEAPA